MADVKVPALLHKMSVSSQKAWYNKHNMALPGHLTGGEGKSAAQAKKDVGEINKAKAKEDRLRVIAAAAKKVAQPSSERVRAMRQNADQFGGGLGGGLDRNRDIMSYVRAGGYIKAGRLGEGALDEVNARHSFDAAQAALTPKSSDVKASLGKTARDRARTNKYARRISRLSGGYSKNDIIDNLKSLANEEVDQIDEVYLNQTATGRSKEGYHDAGLFSKETATKHAAKHGGSVTQDASGKYLVKMGKKKVQEEAEQMDEAAMTKKGKKDPFAAFFAAKAAMRSKTPASSAYKPEVGHRILVGGQLSGEVTKVTDTHVHFIHPVGKFHPNGGTYKTPISNVVREQVEQVDEDLGKVINRAVKSVKRAATGWHSGVTPKDVVKTNMSHDAETARKLRSGPDDGKTTPHSPQDLQNRVLGRKLRRLNHKSIFKTSGSVEEEVDQMDEGKYASTIAAIASAAYQPKVGHRILVGGQIPGEVTKVTDTHVHFIRPVGKNTQIGGTYKTPISNVVREQVEQTSMYNEDKDDREYGYEGDMAMSQLKSIIANAQRLHDMLKPETDLPEWVQSKITLAEDYVVTATNYCAGDLDESVNEEVEQIIEKATRKLARKETVAEGSEGKTPETETEVNLAKKHGDPNKITYGDVIKARIQSAKNKALKKGD